MHSEGYSQTGDWNPASWRKPSWATAIPLGSDVRLFPELGGIRDSREVACYRTTEAHPEDLV
jgi:hypothetical protein